MVVSNKDKIIIGIDPGIRNTGWGVIRHFQNKIEHIEHGVIVPEPNENDALRLHFISINLEKINNQRDLFFNNQEDKNNIDNMIDSINNKFGEFMLRPARLSSEFESPDVISPTWRPKGCKKSL